MKKVVKYDYSKLRLGTEVFCILRGWQKVTDVGTTMFYTKANNLMNSYNNDGKQYSADINPCIVAMKINIKVEDVPTKAFARRMDNWTVEYNTETRKANIRSHAKIEILGAKYYSEKNALLVKEILESDGR